jgi:hypothetical protein
MTVMNRSPGAYITRIAVALYLLADGILGLTERTLWQEAAGARNAPGNEIVAILTQVFGAGDLTRTLIVLFSALAVICGVSLLLELFSPRIPAAEIIILIFLVAWLAFIVLSDVVYAFRDTRNFMFLPWLRVLASHLVALGALVSASRKFG